MRRNLWLRIGLVVAVVVLSLWYLYPPKQRINLGLDLQGGIHLVLGVDTSKAIATQVERAAEEFKAALERKGIGVKRIAREGERAFVVELASPASWNDALTVAAQFQTFERRNNDQATGRFSLVMSDREVSQQSDLATRGAVEKIRNRVDKFGVAEATITRQGDDRILIQLPGVQDPDRAKALIGQTGLLEFKLLDERTSVEEAQAGRLPDTSEVLSQRRVDPQTKAEQKIPYVVQKRTLLTGRIRTHRATGRSPSRSAPPAPSASARSPSRTSAGTWPSSSTAPSTPRRASTSAFPAAAR
jgi:preprotein translocase subunit SecD